MSILRKPIAIKSLTCLLASLVVAMLPGAADQLEDALRRVREMPPSHREELLAELKRFDDRLSTEQQKTIREMDRRLREMPEQERVHYLGVLRNYHNWLASLPELTRDSFLIKPADERIAQLKSLTARHPVPETATPYWLQFSELSGASPFELAAAYKIWKNSSGEIRDEIAKLPTTVQKRERLFEFGKEQRKVARELRPPDFRLDDWLSKAEEKVEELRLIDPELRATLNKAEARVEAAGKTAGSNRPRNPNAILRRLAINLYYLETGPPQPVSVARLDQFFNDLPPWLQGSFDSYSPDEARRRLTIVYRLVFPHPEEIPPRAKPAASASARKEKEAAKPAAPAPSPKPATSPTPF